MSDEGLILITPEEESVEDDLLSALTTLAYAAPVVSEVEVVRRRKSKFFFRLSPSMQQAIKTRSKKFIPKQMEHIDTQVEKRLKVYKKEAPTNIAVNMSKVREFFLNEVGPRSLAGGAGAGQAKEIVQRLLKTKIDDTQFLKFERMSHAAVNLVMAKFVAKYYGLHTSAAASILESVVPPRPSVAAIPSPTPDNQYEPRHAKARREIQERETKGAQGGKEKDTGK